MASYNNWPYIINLGNSIIGVALLAMPFCFKQCGILLSMLGLLFCTWLTLSSSQLLMRAGISSRRKSYEFLAYHTHGAAGKLLTEIGMIGMQLGTLIAQIVVVGDIGPAIISKYFGIENNSGLRTFLIMLLCLCVGLPLGLLKNLRAVSRASTVCITFYCIFVVYVLSLSLPTLWTGAWYPQVHFWRPQGLFQCLPILSFSFGCQTQLFLVYDALPEPSLKAISGVISSAVNLCAVAYLLVGFFGYIAFFSHDIPGDVIAIFPSTVFADMMKLCFVFSIVITFPVIIFPCRASIYTLLFAKKLKSHDDVMDPESFMPETLFKGITICIVLGSMITGILIPNVEFILGMNGAVTGTLICYIFPALFFLRVMETKTEGKRIAQMVLWLGVFILLASTYATLSAEDTTVKPQVLRDGDLGINDGQLAQPDLPDRKGEGIVLGDSEAKRQEPPVPDPPDSVLQEDKKDVAANKEDSKVEKEEQEEKKVLEEREKKLEDTEKKQVELLVELQKQKAEQADILRQQKQVLQELKDHHVQDVQKGLAPQQQAIHEQPAQPPQHDQQLAQAQLQMPQQGGARKVAEEVKPVLQQQPGGQPGQLDPQVNGGLDQGNAGHGGEGADAAGQSDMQREMNRLRAAEQPNLQGGGGGGLAGQPNLQRRPVISENGGANAAGQPDLHGEVGGVKTAGQLNLQRRAAGAGVDGANINQGGQAQGAAVMPAVKETLLNDAQPPLRGQIVDPGQAGIGLVEGGKVLDQQVLAKHEAQEPESLKAKPVVRDSQINRAVLPAERVMDPKVDGEDSEVKGHDDKNLNIGKDNLKGINAIHDEGYDKIPVAAVKDTEKKTLEEEKNDAVAQGVIRLKKENGSDHRESDDKKHLKNEEMRKL